MSAHKCEGRVYQGPGFGFRACGKNAAHEHEGKWFCKTHYPPNILAKDEARDAKWKAEWNARRKAADVADSAKVEVYRRADCYPDLLDALIAAYAYVPPSSPVYQAIADAINQAVKP
jgi:hypothetical protein